MAMATSEKTGPTELAIEMKQSRWARTEEAEAVLGKRVANCMAPDEGCSERRPFLEYPDPTRPSHSPRGGYPPLSTVPDTDKMGAMVPTIDYKVLNASTTPNP